MTENSRAQLARRVVIGWGLTSERIEDKAVELSPTDAHDLLNWVSAERLTGLLCAALDAGALLVPDQSAAHARDAHLSELRITLTLEAIAAQISEVLAGAGINHRLLKGIPAAHLDYPEPSWRNSVDTDLLVSRADLAVALSVIEKAGFVRSELALAPWWEAKFARALVLRSPEGAEVDLHAAIATGYFGLRLNHTALLGAPPATIDIGGVMVAALAGPARLLSSCYAVVLSRGPRARLMRDVAQQALVSRCDWQIASGLARDGDGQLVLATALQECAEWFPALANQPAMQQSCGVRSSRKARRALEFAAAGDQRGWSTDARSSMLAMNIRNRALFCFGVALPPRAHRRARGRTLTKQMMRGVALFRRPN